MASDHGDELGTDWSQRHWRLVSVQAGGGLTVVRQRTRRSMQQLHLAGFLAKHSCTVAGIGDTRLGDGITSFTMSARQLDAEASAIRSRAISSAESCMWAGARSSSSRWESSCGPLIVLRGCRKRITNEFIFCGTS